MVVVALAKLNAPTIVYVPFAVICNGNAPVPKAEIFVVLPGANAVWAFPHWGLRASRRARIDLLAVKACLLLFIN
jgi:hypothetical protein